MKVIAIASMKGGVGKTTTTANLAVVLASGRSAGKVFVIDLDPQNTLRLHFDGSLSDNEGICSHAVRQLPLSGVLHESASGVTCLPYGAVSELERQAFEDMLEADPEWLLRQIASLNLPDDALLLIDTPPGSTPYLAQAFRCADFALLVVLADAASYLTLPAMEGWVAEAEATHPALRFAYLLNQTDNGQALHRDLLDVLRLRLGDRLVPVSVHRDEAVPEAMAYQKSVVDYDPHGQASHDLLRVGAWLAKHVVAQ
jgi:chromosome partitioning protein